MSALSFFQPIYLWGLAALALPLAVHLLNRKRSRRLDFSTVRFFKDTALRAAKMRRLRRIALLCARILLIATIAALFSKPYDPRAVFSTLVDPGGSVYCWIDPTKSMEYREGKGAVLLKAKAVADSIDKKLSPSSRRFLYDDARHAFVDRSSFTFDGNVVTRWGPPDIETMLRAFNRQRRGSTRTATLVVISDFQENVSEGFEAFFRADSAGAPIIGVNVAPATPWNIGILSALVRGRHPTLAVTTLAAVGKDFAGAGVSVITGGMRTGHDAVTIKKGCHATLSIPGSDGAEPNTGLVMLDADDPFPCDNTRFFTAEASSSVRVLIVGDSANSFPIAAALRCGETSAWRPVIMRSPRTVSYEDIDSARVVILNEVGALSGPLLALCEGRSFSNKAVIVSPCIDTGATMATARLFHFSNIRDNITFASHGAPCVPLLPDTLTPLWKGFPRFRETGAVVRRYVRPLPGNTILSLDNHAPLAAHAADSAGRSWVFFAVPIGFSSTNNLCETGMYVPMMDRIVRYSLESVCGEMEQWVAGLPRRNPYLKSRTGALVYDANNHRIAQWEKQPSVVFIEPGLYKIQPMGATSRWVAVNPDSQEITLAYRAPGFVGRGKKCMVFMENDEFLHYLKTDKGFFYAYGLWGALALLLFAEIFLWERRTEKNAKRRREEQS